MPYFSVQHNLSDNIRIDKHCTKYSLTAIMVLKFYFTKRKEHLFLKS